MIISTARSAQARRLIATSANLARTHVFPSIKRHFWRLFGGISLVLIAIGMFFLWRRSAIDTLELSPLYLGLAILIYLITFGLQLAAWHLIATQLFGRLPFRDNAQAVAGSSVMKYLPTVAWYIANRVSFYEQRHVPRKAVVDASLFELIAMVGCCTVFYIAWWLEHINIALAGSLVAAIIVLLYLSIRHMGILQRAWLSIRARRSSSPRFGDLPDPGRPRYYWLGSLACYALLWPLGVCFLWSIVHIFIPIPFSSIVDLVSIWLLSSLASYVASLTLGAFGIARELTLTALLAQFWPLPVAIAAALLVKTLLTLGEIGCSGIILGWLYLRRKRADNA